MLIWLLLCLVNALHYYADTSEEKCFIEDLPESTHMAASYKVEAWDSATAKFTENQNAYVVVSVFSAASQHYILNSQLKHKGKFRFTASERGEHTICLKAVVAGWYSGRMKVYFDLNYGDAYDDTQGVNQERQNKYQELTAFLVNMRERVQQEREAEYRSASELVNTATITWTIIQLIVLGITCAWQLRQLKQFFVAKKLV